MVSKNALVTAAAIGSITVALIFLYDHLVKTTRKNTLSYYPPVIDPRINQSNTKPWYADTIDNAVNNLPDIINMF